MEKGGRESVECMWAPSVTLKANAAHARARARDSRIRKVNWSSDSPQSRSTMPSVPDRRLPDRQPSLLPPPPSPIFFVSGGRPFATFTFRDTLQFQLLPEPRVKWWSQREGDEGRQKRGREGGGRGEERERVPFYLNMKLLA